MATSGSVETEYIEARGTCFRVEWTRTAVDTVNNKSTLTWKLYFETMYSWYLNAIRIDYVKINGTTVKGEETYSDYSHGTFELASGTIDIPHNSDGTKTINIQISGWFYDWGTRTGEANFTLTTIPRPSEITATDGNIGSKSNIKIDRKYSNVTTTVSYKINGQSSYTAIQTKSTNTSISWTIPTACYDYLGASSKTITITLRCITYEGNTQVGDAKTTTITATAVSSACKPTVSTSYSYGSSTNNLTGVTNKGILNFSTITITLTATAKYNATISTKKVTLGGVTKTSSYSFEKMNDNKYTYTVTDSRGFTTSGTVNLTVVNYIRPTAIIEVTPPSAVDGSTTVLVKGDCFNGSFGSVTNSLTVRYGYKESTASSYTYTTLTATKNGNTYSKTATLTLDYTKTYNFIAQVKDSAVTSYVSSAVVTIRTQPIISWSKDNVYFNAPTNFNGNLNSSWSIRIANGTYLQSFTAGGTRSTLIGASSNDNIQVGSTNFNMYLYSNGTIRAQRQLNAPSLSENDVLLSNKYLQTTYLSLGSGTAGEGVAPTFTDSYSCAAYIIVFAGNSAGTRYVSVVIPKDQLGNTFYGSTADTDFAWTISISGTTVTVSRGNNSSKAFYLYGVR